jgi:FdhE protein
VSQSWDRRVRRAERLAAEKGPNASVLAFYARLLQQQRTLYDSFESPRPTGSIEADVGLIVEKGSALLQAVAAYGPDQLAAESRTLLDGGRSTCERLLQDYWHTRSDRQFFPKALFQPYGQWLADAGVARIAGAPASADNRCPRCGGRPQASILGSILGSAGGVSSDGTTRELLCATCLTTWPFRRVVCPSCGEDDEGKLGYFQSPVFEHVRVDACESCRRYLKTIDLGRLGLAVPLVDEVAGAHLDVWAHDHGYEKIELNLVGL